MISRPRSIGALVLVVSSALLWSGCATSGRLGEHGDDCAGIKNHNIEIGSVVSCKWVYLKSNANGQGNTINWRATDSGKNVKITFDDASVFPSLNCPGNQNVCQSGALNPAIVGDSSKEYRYHASLCDAQGTCGSDVDPGIIIVP